LDIIVAVDGELGVIFIESDAFDVIFKKFFEYMGGFSVKYLKFSFMVGDIDGKVLNGFAHELDAVIGEVGVFLW